MVSLSRTLPQLVGPAQCAKDIADFLVQRKDKLTKPLRTLRFLASPSDEEAGPAFKGIQAATAANVAQALLGWRQDARRSDDEVTFFYFAGHGSQLSQTNALLLLSDYLGGLKTFDRTIEVNDIYGGMGASPATKIIGRTQFYFIDACRVDEALFKDIKQSETCVPWDVFDIGPAGRAAAPIYFAAAPGEATKTLTDDKKKTTRFGQRLLNCLREGAAEQIGSSAWAVTVGQMAKALDRLSVQQNLEAGSRIDTFLTNAYSESQTVIHQVDNPPVVPCTFRFDPSSARRGIGLFLDNFTPSPLNLAAELKDPHNADIPAGFYRLSSVPKGSVPETSITLRTPMMEILINGTGLISWV